MLVIICGLPGSGKTTIGKALAERLGAAYLGSDTIRKEMHGKPTYEEDEKRQVYRRMAEAALRMFRGGEETVVLDATFYRSEYIEMAESAAKSAGSVVRVVRCALGDDEARKRLEARKAGPSDADYKVYLKVKEGFEPIEGEHLELDTSKPTGRCINEIIEYIARMEKLDRKV